MRRHAVRRPTDESSRRRTLRRPACAPSPVAPPIEDRTRSPPRLRALPTTPRRRSRTACCRDDAGRPLAAIAPATACTRSAQSPQTLAHGSSDPGAEAPRRRACLLRDRAAFTRAVVGASRLTELHRVPRHLRRRRNRGDGSSVARVDRLLRPQRRSPKRYRPRNPRVLSLLPRKQRSRGQPASRDRRDDPRVEQKPAFARSCVPKTPVHASTFVGSIADEEKWRLLQTAAMLVFMSRFDGPPRPIREALSVGTPCLVSYESNMGELIESFGAGRAAPLEAVAVANCLDEAFASAGTLESWQAGARRLRAELSWPNVARTYLAGYESIGVTSTLVRRSPTVP